MEHNACVFCAIIEGKIPAVIVANHDNLIVIKDRAPKAPIHYLIIPKKHISSLAKASPEDIPLLGEMLLMARTLSQEMNQHDFRIVSNNGAKAGQSVFHLHIHYLAGKEMYDL